MNVVFDLGGVVVTWRPEEIIARVFDDAKARALVREGLFGHADWLDLDRGTIERERAIERAAERTGLSSADLTRLMHEVPPALVPIPETIALVRRVKAAGHRLFCLSNMHFASIEHLEERYDFFQLFEAAVISCRLKLIKPDAAIFRHLLETYRLAAADTVFIDDYEPNVAAAARLGIRTIRFEDAAQCERELGRIGALP